MSLTTGDLSLVSRTIHRARAKLHPPLPKSKAATHEALREMEIITNTGEDFFIVNDDTRNIFGFFYKN